MTPCRKAALRTVSSSSTSISMPTGSKRTVCLVPISLLSRSGGALDAGAGGKHRLALAPGSGGAAALVGYRCRSPARAAVAVLRSEVLALLGGHGIQQDVGAG